MDSHMLSRKSWNRQILIRHLPSDVWLVRENCQKCILKAWSGRTISDWAVDGPETFLGLLRLQTVHFYNALVSKVFSSWVAKQLVRRSFMVYETRFFKYFLFTTSPSADDDLVQCPLPSICWSVEWVDRLIFIFILWCSYFTKILLAINFTSKFKLNGLQKYFMPFLSFSGACLAALEYIMGIMLFIIVAYQMFNPIT